MTPKLEHVLAEVRSAVTPSEDEKRKLSTIAGRVLERIRTVAREMGVGADPMVVGSFAKDTWLANETDLDIFVLFDETTSRAEIERTGLELAERVAGGGGVKAYAEHPYVRFFEEGVRIDLVPAVRVSDTSKLVTAVDRTPFHVEFVKKRLTEALKSDVRLLKRFMKGTGVYGAESRTSGFSGYVCELLVLRYGSFSAVLKSASEWRPGTVVNLGGIEVSNDILSSHFVLVDPTDPRRNAAAAVSIEAMGTFVLASTSFLREPGIHYFFPRQNVTEKEPDPHFVLLELALDLVEEVAWSELRSSSRSIAMHLDRAGFGVRDYGYLYFPGTGYMLLELDRIELPPVEKRTGPPFYLTREVDSFVTRNMDTMTKGPWLEGERVVIVKKRGRRALEEFLGQEREIDLAPHVRASYAQRKVLVDEMAVAHSKTKGFYQEVCTFLSRPSWLSRV
jgi:tRNA nucleotidyltransferase (CCA-adding enzyme)